MLKPIDTMNEYKSNKIKKDSVSKNSNKVKGLSITKGNKVLSKKDKKNIKTKIIIYFYLLYIIFLSI